jgi:pimeloyl-ACP methyl ester carboxylesterase
MAERFDITRNGASLAGERWPGGDRTVLLLHENIADRRGWAEVAGLLAPELTIVAYDRRGYGQTPVSTEPFSHLDDLLAVLDNLGVGPVWLVGASGGGGLALDATLVAPHRVAGLVLMGTAVSGAPAPELDADTKRFEPLLEKAYAARDAAEINRLETWLWLDGPGQQEGRVGGAARDLALDMNAVIIGNGVPEEAGRTAGVDAWHRLAEIKVPVTVACGDLDVPFVVDRCRLLADRLLADRLLADRLLADRLLADRLPAARHHVLTGMAHQPYLESASTVARLIRSAVTGSLTLSGADAFAGPCSWGGLRSGVGENRCQAGGVGSTLWGRSAIRMDHEPTSRI